MVRLPSLSQIVESFKSESTADNLTFVALPALLAGGWFIHLTWMIGMEGFWAPALAIVTLLGCLGLYIRNGSWQRRDLRWLLAPVLVTILAIYLPWWDLILSNIVRAG